MDASAKWKLERLCRKAAKTTAAVIAPNPKLVRASVVVAIPHADKARES